MNFIVDVDNYGYVNHEVLTLRINDMSSKTMIAETTITDLTSSTSQKTTLFADLSTFGDDFVIEIISTEGEVLDSQMVTVSKKDYSILLGDYFCDGVVNPNDATALLQKIAYDKTDSEREHLSGDINENDRIEPNDVTAILQYCAELISNFK